MTQNSNDGHGAQDASKQRLEERSRQVLDDSATRLSGRTLSRLTQARYAALEQARKPERMWWRQFAPAGAVAAVAVLAVAIYAGRPNTSDPSIVVGAPAAIEVDLFADVDALDLAEEGDELDFYEWAALEARDTDAALGS